MFLDAAVIKLNFLNDISEILNLFQTFAAVMYVIRSKLKINVDCWKNNKLYRKKSD